MSFNSQLEQADLYVGQQRYPEAKKLLKQILDEHPLQLEAMKLLLQCYMGTRLYYSAVDLLEAFPLERAAIEAMKAEVFLAKWDHRNAFECASKCVELDPLNPDYYLLLGQCYIRKLQFEQSVEAFKKALALDPNHVKTLSLLLALQVRICEWKERGEVVKRLRTLSSEDAAGEISALIQPAIAVLTGFTNEEIHKIAAARCRQIEKETASLKDYLRFSYDIRRRKRIKIGYLSSDFQNHATMHLMLDVFGLHDRGKFEIFAYSHGKNDWSFYGQKAASDCDRFMDIRMLSDEQAAKMINQDGIDILVDLKGHTTDARLNILALRPAPIQIHYLGYPGTIGGSFIDYLIADSYLIPESERNYYQEAIVYMPITYQANTAEKKVLKRPLSKGDYGITEGFFVFCCFNQNDKFDTETVDAWMKILKEVPSSVLWLWGNYEGLKEKLGAYAKDHGISLARFIITPSEPSPKHMAKLALPDLFLDTFNYSAHTSCSDAIRAGLPLLTRPGATFASRVAASLLKQVKADMLIADSKEDYIRKAIEFAQNPAKLAEAKNAIIRNRDRSRLYDSKLFTSCLDEAYLGVWERCLAGLPPGDIHIPIRGFLS